MLCYAMPIASASLRATHAYRPPKAQCVSEQWWSLSQATTTATGWISVQAPPGDSEPGTRVLPLAFHGNGSPGHTGYQTSVNVNGAAHGSIPHTGVCNPLSKLDSQSKLVVVQTERGKMPRPVTLGLGPRGGGGSRSRRLGAEHVVLPATEATTPSFSVTDRASHRKRPTPRGPEDARAVFSATKSTQGGAGAGREATRGPGPGRGGGASAIRIRRWRRRSTRCHLITPAQSLRCTYPGTGTISGIK